MAILSLSECHSYDWLNKFLETDFRNFSDAFVPVLDHKNSKSIIPKNYKNLLLYKD